jgi:hypothetical protein
MPRVKFVPTIPVSKRAKTVHALDDSATVTGIHHIIYSKKNHFFIYETKATEKSSREDGSRFVSQEIHRISWKPT